MSTDFKRVRDYELMVVFHPELSEEDLASESQKVEGHITSVDGTMRLVNREAPWGRRRLAYPIRHGSRDVRDGVYVLYYFTSESDKLSEIEREIKLQDRIIRYLLTQQSAPVMEPAPAEGEEAQAADDEGAPAAGEATPEQPTAEVAEVAATGEESPAPVESPEPDATDEQVAPEPDATEEPVAPEQTSEETSA